MNIYEITRTLLNHTRRRVLKLNSTKSPLWKDLKDTKVESPTDFTYYKIMLNMIQFFINFRFSKVLYQFCYALTLIKIGGNILLFVTPIYSTCSDMLLHKKTYSLSIMIALFKLFLSNMIVSICNLKDSQSSLTLLSRSPHVSSWQSFSGMADNNHPIFSFMDMLSTASTRFSKIITKSVVHLTFSIHKKTNSS